MNQSWYVPKANNVDHTISRQGTAISTLDHSATTPMAYETFQLYAHFSGVHMIWQILQSDHNYKSKVL